MRTPRPRSLLIVMIMAVLAVAVPAAASHVFTDVGSNTAHHDAIAELAGSGITVGCATNPDRYCPGTAVNRGQMATFMTRGLPRTIADHSTTTLSNGSGVPVTVTVDATGDTAAGATGYVSLQGSVTVFVEGDASACPCEVEAFVYRARDAEQGPSSWSMLGSETSANGTTSVSLPVTWAARQPAGTRDEYRLEVFVDGAPSGARAEASLTAITTPLGQVP